MVGTRPPCPFCHFVLGLRYFLWVYGYSVVTVLFRIVESGIYQDLWDGTLL